MLRINSLILTLLLFSINPIHASEDQASPGNWEFVGDGFTSTVDDAVLISEFPGSKGVMLVSPSAYGNEITVRFKVMPLNPESVLVAMLSTSDAGPATTLTFPNDYDGNISTLLEQVDCYFFAFHNAAHKRTPFVRKHPFIKGESKDLDAAEANIMTTQWQQVELTTSAQGAVKMKVDGQAVLNTVDGEPLPGGKILFRLRGTKTHTATALIKDLEIVSD